MSKAPESIKALEELIAQAQSYSKSIKKITIVWKSVSLKNVQNSTINIEMTPDIIIEYYE